MLKKSFHPDFLRNALDRDRHFDRLWLKVKQQPSLVRLLQAERVDLLNGDIPMFTGHINSRDIYTSQNQVVSDYLGESGFELVTRRLENLSEQDLKVQLWLIRAAFATVPMGYSGTTWKESILVPGSPTASTEQLVAAACSIGDRLADTAVRANGAVNWMGLSPVSESEWQLEPASYDLYSGAGGITLFLAYLGKVSGQPQFTELSRAGLETTRRTLRQYLEWEKRPMVGMFQGLGSPIYLFSHLAQLWNEPTLLDEAEQLVIHLPDQIGRDDLFDIVTGAAGCLVSLLSLYSLRQTPTTLAAAIACGDHLLQKSTPLAGGIGWLNSISPQFPLAGLSHGVAGIALSLLRLYHLTGDKRYLAGAKAAISYERTLFNPAVGNWVDARSLEQAGDRLYPIQWCHGAAGIGLARLGCLDLEYDSAMQQEIKTAIETTLGEGFGLNHCLCHGDLGNFELLLVAGKRYPEFQKAAQEHSAMILNSIQKQGYLTGLPMGIESPGFMTGLAGIGYGLLRMAYPLQVPSVLLFEPPVTS